MKLVFASQNGYKLKEAQNILSNFIEITSLRELDFLQDLPETHFTLEENAEEKATFVFQHLGMNCFAEDTELEIEALNGAPGVFSARYAGEEKNADDNIRLVLEQMQSTENRIAKFRTIICLILEGNKFYFEGSMRGNLAYQQKGNFGFGYDPIFIPEGFEQTFAEMDLKLKNDISHRKKALDKMKIFLKEAMKQ